MKTRALTTAVAALLLAACSGNKVTTWENPASKGQTFRNVAVFAIVKDPSVRKTTENAFLMAATGATKVTPSFKFATNDDLKDKDRLVARLKEGGFDGAVIFRVIAVDERTEEYKSAQFTAAYYGATYYGGMYYGGFGSYWGYYGAPVYSTTYTKKEQIVQIESTLYAVKDEKLAFAQQSKLDNPDSTMDVIESVVRGAAAAMKSAKLID